MTFIHSSFLSQTILACWIVSSEMIMGLGFEKGTDILPDDDYKLVSIDSTYTIGLNSNICVLDSTPENYLNRFRTASASYTIQFHHPITSPVTRNLLGSFEKCKPTGKKRDIHLRDLQASLDRRSVSPPQVRDSAAFLFASYWKNSMQRSCYCGYKHSVPKPHS
ncbi:hypothetical protein BDV24DRAFT_13690 [Aspergillus arachidicola]|uniref:Uncharacterized protein n=1 Tax=Aspergillus arachidicola TaxID=656916 RepID=A0A5N6YM80_9EURO|nr:hypothetical protein BDV24DRAFT_13690 [Aspergillus arachidicola]